MCRKRRRRRTDDAHYAAPSFLANPKLLSNKITEAIPDLGVARDRRFAAGSHVDVDIVPAAVPMEKASGRL
jgi:hypothetical protein